MTGLWGSGGFVQTRRIAAPTDGSGTAPVDDHGSYAADRPEGPCPCCHPASPRL
jgi:hypothetical protein